MVPVLCKTERPVSLMDMFISLFVRRLYITAMGMYVDHRLEIVERGKLLDVVRGLTACMLESS